MINLDKTLYGASLFALAFSLSAAEVSAQTCTAAPSCDTLGFTKSATDCTGHSVLKCPFDQSKLYCDSGASGSGGEESNCGVGDILYSDKTCSVELIANKTPIGVVFDQNGGRAIALLTEKRLWSDGYFDIPDLKNYEYKSDAEKDYSGKNNTVSAVAYCKENSKSCPATEYAANYSTRGTSAGDWYLPALGELKAIYDVKDTLNETLAKISSATLIPIGSESEHWSSSEKNNTSAWHMYFNGGSISDTFKYSENYSYYTYFYHYVRPVLAF